MSKRNEVKHEIYKEIAAETGCSINEIEKVAEAQFSFIKKIIERGEFDTIRLPYLGKFGVNPKRVQNLNNRDAVIQRRKLSGDNRS